jgi:FixJ family two-component response regulator
MESILVAVVDDEEKVRVALGRLLRLADYEVAGFASGEDFLASLSRRIPDCALLDVNMPGLSGLQVQARLHADRVALPIVFITAGDDLAIDRSALEGGGLRVLHKPFDNDQLLAAVQFALGAPAPAVCCAVELHPTPVPPGTGSGGQPPAGRRRPDDR